MSAVSASAFTSLAQRYLVTLGSDPDPRAHHQLHSRDAHLLLGAEAVPAGSLTAAAYDDRLRALAGPAGLHAACQRGPRFSFVGIDRVLPGPRLPGDETLALVTLREEPGGAARIAAFAAVQEDGAPRLRWATLVHTNDGGSAERSGGPFIAERSGAPFIDAERLQAQAHGELAYLPLTGQPLMLTTLALSARRQFAAPPIHVSYLPEARFSCHQSGRCCSNEWRIHLSQGDAAALRARDFPRRLPQLARDPLVVLSPSEAAESGDPRPFAIARRDEAGGDHRCVFLTDDQRCLVHAEAGFAVYHDCHVYPYGFAFTPEGVSAFGLLSCPSARAQRGRSFADNDADLRRRLARVPGQAPTAFWLCPGVPLPWPAFRDGEAALLRYLGEDAAPLPRRVLAALRWLEGWSGGAPPPYDPRLLTDPVPPPVGPEREIAAAVFHMTTQNPYLAPVVRGDAAAERPPLSDPPFAAYLLRTLVFSKALSYPHGVVPGFNYVALAYALLLRRLGGRPISEVPEEELGAFFSGLQHAPYQRLIAALQEQPLLRELAATPLYGALLLRVALTPGA